MNQSAARLEFMFKSWRPSNRISGIASLVSLVRSVATRSGSKYGVENLLPCQMWLISWSV